MAQISNLHFGLAPWATGSFIAGQRCSNAGSAYQCTSPGSSTTPPIGTGSAISGGGGTVFKFLSTVDFTSPQAWANSLPATPTQPIILNVWNDGPITTTSGVPVLALSGHATTPSNSITIQAAAQDTLKPGVLAFNSAAGPSFVLPASGVGNQNYFNIQDNYVTFKGLQFKDPNPGSGSTIFYCGATFTAFGCIFDGYSQSGGAYMFTPNLSGPSSSVYSLINCLVVDRAASSAVTATIRGNYAGKLINNTFVAINSPASLQLLLDVSSSSTQISVTNNIALGYTTTFVYNSNSSSTNITVRYGLNSASSFTNSNVTTGAGNIFSAPTSGQFVNSATNFNLAPLSQANNTALTDTADLPSAVDIFGNARIPPWDMGCVQLSFPASVGTASGHASSQGVPVVGVTRGVGTAAGQASSQGVPFIYSVGTASGQASSQGVSTANASVGRASGQASVQGFSAAGAIEGIIALDGVHQQVVNVPFQVSGTLTLMPDLQIADDSSAAFTRISDKDVSPLGSTDFEFTHPGVSTPGAHNILVEDLSTAATVAANYNVGPVVPDVTHPPFTGPTLTSLATIIPAYVYQEYSDDLNVAAFFQAYNILAQGYLDYLNNLNLPVYQGLSGALLDWVGAGLYGIPRPVLSLLTPSGALIGPFNTYQLNEIAINTLTGPAGSFTSISVTDDIYKRIITWNIYRGDGTAFTATWLKRRVMRFLAGVNGTDYIGPTVQVSVSYTGFNTINVTISAGAVELTMAPVLQLAVLTGAISIPFQYTLNVLV